MNNKKIAIIGAGITGLAAGHSFQEKGHSVILYEKESVPGGLISCSNIDGILFHKVGGHVFNSRIPEVLDWFWSKFDKSDFSQTKRIAKIFMNDQIFGYPIENYIHLLPSEIIKRIVNELLDIHKANARFETSNFDDFLKLHFGNTLYNLYFKPYNDKIWKVDLKKIPLKWLEGKLPTPNIPEILVSNIISAEESTMVHSTFWYPKKGGSQFIADTLAKGLTINYDQDVSKIEKRGTKWIINKESFDEVIYTGDIRNLASLLSNNVLPMKQKDLLIDLNANGTSNVLCEINKNNYSWMYFPENKYKIHRIIYTGNFAESNNGNALRNTCTIEYSGYLSKEELAIEVEKLPGAPKILGYNYEPNSYVYHTSNTESIISTIKKQLEKQSFHLIGRFAEWQYYNMDKAIEAGMNLIKKI